MLARRVLRLSYRLDFTFPVEQKSETVHSEARQLLIATMVVDRVVSLFHCCLRVTIRLH